MLKPAAAAAAATAIANVGFIAASGSAAAASAVQILSEQEINSSTTVVQLLPRLMYNISIMRAMWTQSASSHPLAPDLSARAAGWAPRRGAN